MNVQYRLPYSMAATFQIKILNKTKIEETLNEIRAPVLHDYSTLRRRVKHLAFTRHFLSYNVKKPTSIKTIFTSDIMVFRWFNLVEICKIQFIAGKDYPAG